MIYTYKYSYQEREEGSDGVKLTTPVRDLVINLQLEHATITMIIDSASVPTLHKFIQQNWKHFEDGC